MQEVELRVLEVGDRGFAGERGFFLGCQDRKLKFRDGVGSHSSHARLLTTREGGKINGVEECDCRSAGGAMRSSWGMGRDGRVRGMGPV
jgi:hypothetical protein